MGWGSEGWAGVRKDGLGLGRTGWGSEGWAGVRKETISIDGYDEENFISE